MQSIKEFMQCYFSERTELYRAWVNKGMPFRESFFTENYLTIQDEQWEKDWVQEQTQPPIVLIHTLGDSTEVITSELDFGVLKRYRYSLRISEAGWQIDHIGKECTLCHGKNVGAVGGCSLCNGVGWVYD